MIKRYQSTAVRRELRTRAKVGLNVSRPRLTVFRSNKYMSAQIIDDVKGVTLAAATNKDPKTVGTDIAKAALAAGVKAIVFDRGSYNYHGRVKLLAEAARAGGLDF